MSTNLMPDIEQEIEQILSHSPVPEDHLHGKGVKEWVLRLKPEADLALQIAALAHDIERALPEKKVCRENYEDYDAFKQAHAQNSARIVTDILSKYPLNAKLKRRVAYLIEHHEVGPDNDSDLSVLKEADSLSFFETNLPHYFLREGEEETLFRMRWGYERLSEQARERVRKWRYESDILNRIFRMCISSFR